MKTLLATGVSELDDAIAKRLKTINVVGSATHTEEVKKLILEKRVRHVVVSELLEGDISFKELILSIKKYFPSVHIVSILKEENSPLEKFLKENNVYDVLKVKFTVEELEKKLNYPNTYELEKQNE